MCCVDKTRKRKKDTEKEKKSWKKQVCTILENEKEEERKPNGRKNYGKKLIGKE